MAPLHTPMTYDIIAISDKNSIYIQIYMYNFV